MIKLLVGVKGTGKTKALIAAANQALETSKGYVVCIEKGATLRHEISYKVRLVNTDDYLIDNAAALGGLVAGILAGNSDVTDLFIDGTARSAATTWRLWISSCRPGEGRPRHRYQRHHHSLLRSRGRYRDHEEVPVIQVA